MPKILIGILMVFILKIDDLKAQNSIEDFKKNLIEKEKDSSTVISNRTYGFIAEMYSYSQLLYDKIGVGGYYFAATYRLLPNSTIGLGYDYSLYNHSILLDIRQEMSRMRIKPLLFANLGYSVLANKQSVKSTLGIVEKIEAKRNIVYKIGIGSRTYVSKKAKIGLNFGLFYKNEPGFDISESKSGIIVIDKFQNVSSLCIFLGLSM